MKCEICHKADAETAIVLKKDGEERELYVCKKCAAAAKHPKGGKRGNGKSVTVIGPGKDAPPFVEEFFKAALGLVDGLGHLEEERKNGKKACPLCHSTWDDLDKHGRLGCPECWKTFAPEIRKKFLNGTYGPAHVGSMPAGAAGAESRAYLERELKKAIKKQNYEKAAEIKLRLDKLGPGAQDGHGKEST